jgi:hypothetical protein
MSKKRVIYHIEPAQKGGWAIRKEDRKRELLRFPTKDEAVQGAMEFSQEEEADIVVHRKDGSVEKVGAYEQGTWKPVPKFDTEGISDPEDIRSVVRAVFVVPQEGAWVVTKGGEPISPASDNILDALQFAWDIRRERGTEIIVYDTEGNALRSSSFTSFDEFVDASARVDR